MEVKLTSETISEIIKNSIYKMENSKPDNGRKYLVGSKEMIEGWKTMYGDTVDYYEQPIIKIKE